MIRDPSRIKLAFSSSYSTALGCNFAFSDKAVVNPKPSSSLFIHILGHPIIFDVKVIVNQNH